MNYVYNIYVLAVNRGKIWTLVGFFVFAVIIYFLFKHTDYITEILVKSGPLAPIVALLLYTGLAPTPIPTDPITVVLGVTYGPMIGVIIAWVGNTLATLVEYYVGCSISKTANFEKQKEKMPFGLANLPIGSVPFLVFGRMIPGYGSKIISILAGAYSVPIKRYLWTSALTNLLGAIMLSYGGFGLITLFKNLF